MRFCIILGSMVILAATPAFAQHTQTFLYDVHGRLIETRRTEGGGGAQTTTYALDDADNRTTRSVSASSSARAAAPMPEVREPESSAASTTRDPATEFSSMPAVAPEEGRS